jgi:6-aminohexanoate-oligomer endohydrolase
MAAQMKSNDSIRPTPRVVDLPAGRTLAFDFPALHVGCAEYDEGPTGCTIFHFPGGARCVADIRGGAHCCLYTDYIADADGFINAICLAGGSFYGLEAATGVGAELFAQRNFDTSFFKIALVTGAIIYDFRLRDNAVYPDKELGRAALRAAKSGTFPLGPRGVGRNATCGKFAMPRYQLERGGQGGAFGQFGETKVAVFTVVNAVGSIIDRAGDVVRGTLDEKTGERVHPRDIVAEAKPPEGNTTLTVLVTNRKLDGFDLRQLARQVHASMARAIDPFHLPTDGHVFFGVATDETNHGPRLPELGVRASELAWDAVLSCFDR